MFFASLVVGGSCFQSSAATAFHDFNVFNVSSNAPTISLFCQDTKKCHVCLIADDRADCAVTNFPGSFLAYMLMEEEAKTRGAAAEKKVEHEAEEELVYKYPENKVESGYRNASVEKVQEDACPVSEGENMFFNSTSPAPRIVEEEKDTYPALFSFEDNLAEEDTCPALFTVEDYKVLGNCSAADVFYEKEPVCLIEEGPRSNE